MGLNITIPMSGKKSSYVTFLRFLKFKLTVVCNFRKATVDWKMDGRLVESACCSLTFRSHPNLGFVTSKFG